MFEEQLLLLGANCQWYHLCQCCVVLMRESSGHAGVRASPVWTIAVWRLVIKGPLRNTQPGGAQGSLGCVVLKWICKVYILRGGEPVTARGRPPPIPLQVLLLLCKWKFFLLAGG